MFEKAAEFSFSKCVAEYFANVKVIGLGGNWRQQQWCTFAAASNPSVGPLPLLRSTRPSSGAATNNQLSLFVSTLDNDQPGASIRKIIQYIKYMFGHLPDSLTNIWAPLFKKIWKSHLKHILYTINQPPETNGKVVRKGRVYKTLYCCTWESLALPNGWIFRKISNDP